MAGLAMSRQDGPPRAVPRRAGAATGVPWTVPIRCDPPLTGNTRSSRTCVPMVACISIPAFPLRAALRRRPDLLGRAATLAPRPGEPDVVGSCTRVAEEAGVRPGMRLGEALATCPTLVLIEQDPATAAEEWEAMIRRLESAGFAVEPVEQGCALVDTSGLERLAGGLDAVLARALEAVGTGWGARVGAASRKFAAIAAASVAAPGRALVVDDGETALFLEPLPLDLLPLSAERRKEISALGVRQLGDLARLPGPSVSDRLGPDGEEAWRLARGEDTERVRPRAVSTEIAETLAFPEPIANLQTLERALATMLERLLARPERAGRAPRQVVLVARLVGGGSWRHAQTLREPTAEARRIRTVLDQRLQDVPAPVLELGLSLGQLVDRDGIQEELVRPEGESLRARLRDGLRQVRASVGRYAVCTVVEVAPWSRVPETRAILVPRDD